MKRLAPAQVTLLEEFLTDWEEMCRREVNLRPGGSPAYRYWHRRYGAVQRIRETPAQLRAADLRLILEWSGEWEEEGRQWVDVRRRWIEAGRLSAVSPEHNRWAKRHDLCIRLREALQPQPLAPK